MGSGRRRVTGSPPGATYFDVHSKAIAPGSHSADQHAGCLPNPVK